jgi:predicted transposase YbfD/YdcC
MEVEEWGEVKLPWLRTWLPLPNGIPSHDTVGRVFGRLNPAHPEQGLLRWARDLAPEATGAGGVIAIDGKTVRAARQPGERARHLVSAWASADRLVFGRVAVADKSNEIAAIPDLLAHLDLADQVVTTDAMGCQAAIAAQFVAQGGDYLLALKENRPGLLTHVCDGFAPAAPSGTSRTAEKGHGRIEVRTCRTIADPGSAELA